MLECAINISEARDRAVVAEIVRSAGPSCIDQHTDPWHNRTVLTLAGPDIYQAAIDVARTTIELCDFSAHEGVHPAIGSLDVVPFTPLGSNGFGPSIDLTAAVAMRDAFAATVGHDLALPCFTYGPERSLPSVRREAFGSLEPTTGPRSPHQTAGGCCVGARPMLVAYNVYLTETDITLARQIASAIRSSEVRALGLTVGDEVQVSCNLVAPWAVGPAEVVDMITQHASVCRTELVGLVPDAVLRAVPHSRWAELDLSAETTIEARLPRAAISSS